MESFCIGKTASNVRPESEIPVESDFRLNKALYLSILEGNEKNKSP